MTNETIDENTRTFPLDGPINLFVRIAHGSVTVRTRDDLAEASVHLTQRTGGADPLSAEPPVAAVMQGPTLHVAAPREGGMFELFGRAPRPPVDVTVVVPTGTAVKITTHDAPITVEGSVGGADIAFGRAEADLGVVTGDLRLRFGQGRVQVKQVSGGVQVRSGGGDVLLGEVGGGLRSGCGSGDIDVQVVRGRVNVRSGSGTARLHEVHGDVDIASGSGTMEIGLPGGVPVRVDVQTGSGRVRTELPIENEPASTERAITVRARTGHGDVRLFRAA